MKYSVIIVAAGKGTRTKLDYNKVFYPMNGTTVIQHTVQPFIEDIDCKQIIMVISKQEQSIFTQHLQHQKIQYVEGGTTRQESSYNGLQAVTSTYVMIHDGARPFITMDQIHALKHALLYDDAALLMVPVIDTIKEVKDGYVVHTPNRSNYQCAQTPQAFKTELIKLCHEQAKHNPNLASDDAMLVELYSSTRIKVVEGSYDNIKVTTPKDLVDLLKK